MWQTFAVGSHRDFDIYVRAAEAVSRGENPYLAISNINDPRWTSQCEYIYPPLLAVVLSWILHLDNGISAILFVAFNVWALGAITSTMLALGGLAPHISRAPLALMVFVLWPPIINGMAQGQINLIVLWLVLSFTLALRDGRTTKAGVALAFAVQLKMTPLLLLVTVVSRSRRAVLPGFVITSLLLVCGTLVVGGWRHGKDFSRYPLS
jgi:hypothetical protein